jgi:NAD(P)-dependent dehydrogenase (short-subunit alcohol dehydrogenase family)
MRNVVVVLGASGGIGRAVTASQIAHGRHVVAAGRGEAVLDMKDEYVSPLLGDASKREVLKEVFETAAAIGPVDAVVHTLFADSRIPLTELRDDALLQVFDTGAASALKAAQLLYEHGTRPAACVLIGSIHAGLGEANMAAYSTVKAALRGVNLAIAVEWGPQGLRCNLA